MSETEDLKKRVEELEKTLSVLDKSAKMLVRRDVELRRVTEKLQDLDRAKSEFVSIAAHQMRTPLSAIKWSQQMLQDEELGPLNSDQKNIVKQTQDSVTRLVTLINNLLDADHLEIGNSKEKLKKLNLSAVIETVVERLKPYAHEKKVELVLHHADEPLHIMAYAERIDDIFLNLIDNAIKYTPSLGKITVTLTSQGEYALASVSDTGMGIPDDYKRKLFSRFERADNAKRVDPDGSGLGLYIVNKIVEASGGSIDVKSTQGEGAEFVVKFNKI